MVRPRSLERRIFAWLAALAVLPALAVLSLSLVAGSRSLEWLGTLGPWSRVADSGRALIEAVERSTGTDSVVVAAAARHRDELSGSLMQANRWRFLGQRLLAVAPVLGGAFALALIALALLLSRRLAHQMARPVSDLVAWSGRLGRGEPLPGQTSEEAEEVIEVKVLRAAMRNAAEEIEVGRRRGLELERTRAWGEMARRVAHEMKNPLTPLRLAAFRLERGIRGPNGAESEAVQVTGPGGLREAVTVIKEETDRLEELAQSFAQLGRPPAGPATEVDLGELLQNLLETDVPPGIQKQLRVEPGTLSILGHYDGLQRAFRNVIRNAVEAVGESNSSGGGMIDVHVRDTGPDSVQVTIGDNGPGIPEGFEEAIFEPDRTFKAKGTGLGLAVVRQVTASHGGSVMARRRPTGGAEFVIALPRVLPRALAQNTRG